MIEPTPKTFDCVQSMRRIRDQLSGEIATLTYDELVKWFRAHDYADPILRRLSEKAARQADAVTEASPRR